MNETRRPFFLRFGISEQIAFAKRLAMLLRSGVPPARALQMICSPARSSGASHILSRITKEFSRGKELSACLAEFGGIFGTFAISIVEIGEGSGTLHEALAYLAEELKKQQALRKKVIGALVYPAVIMCATVGISIVLTVVIFPKILPVFRGFKQQLPLPTRVLIALSSILINEGWLVMTCFIALVVGLFSLARVPRMRGLIDRGILYIPIFGKLARSYAVGNCSRTVGLLLKGGTPIVRSLEIAAQSASNSAYREALRNMANFVGRGEPLSAQLERYPPLFPSLATQMIRAGEEAGDLAGSLMYVSEVYEEEIGDLTRNLTTLLEPLLMLVMGAVVGFVAISIIAPIYGITQNLST